jgi:hypothetical protein
VNSRKSPALEVILPSGSDRSTEPIGVSGLRAEAAKRDVTPDELAAEFIAERVKPRKHRLRFAAIGASTSGRRAVDAEDMLAEGFGR